MKIKIDGEFENREEFDIEKNKTREFLEQWGFKDISCSEDLFSSKWYFRCEKNISKNSEPKGSTHNSS